MHHHLADDSRAEEASVTVWHWLAGLGVVVLLCGTKGAVRGGILVLLLTFFVARLLYLWVVGEQWP